MQENDVHELFFVYFGTIYGDRISITVGHIFCEVVERELFGG